MISFLHHRLHRFSQIILFHPYQLSSRGASRRRICRHSAALFKLMRSDPSLHFAPFWMTNSKNEGVSNYKSTFHFVIQSEAKNLKSVFRSFLPTVVWMAECFGILILTHPRIYFRSLQLYRSIRYIRYLQYPKVKYLLHKPASRNAWRYRSGRSG